MIQQNVDAYYIKYPDREITTGSILEKEKVYLQYASGIRVEDKFYFSAMYINGLFELDLNDFNVKFICHFSGEDRDRILIHTGCAIEYKSTIYFFPLCSKQIHCYDLITGKEHAVVIPLSDGEEFLTAGIARRENKIWLFSGDSAKGVSILDMDDQTIISAETLNEPLSKYGIKTGWVDVPEERRVFTYCINSSILLEINLEKEQIKEHKVPLEGIDVYSFNYCDGKFYFIEATSGVLYEWEWDNTYLRKFESRCVERMFVKHSPFCNYCLVNGEIYMIPWDAKHVMKVKREEGKMERAFEYPEDFQYIDSGRTDYKSGMMSFYEVIENDIWLHPCGGNQLLIYDTISGTIIGKKITIDVSQVFPCKGIFYENNHKALDYFCYCVKKDLQSNTKTEDPFGKRIYRALNEGKTAERWNG